MANTRKMKIIFLDIDGVLNYEALTRTASWNLEKPETMLCPQAVARLNTIIEKTGAKVIITSTWKDHFKLEEIATAFKSKGFAGEIIGSTESRALSSRADEIGKWLAKQLDMESFAILDDMTNFGMLSDFHVCTAFKNGLTDSDAQKAIAILQQWSTQGNDRR